MTTEEQAVQAIADWMRHVDQDGYYGGEPGAVHALRDARALYRSVVAPLLADLEAALIFLAYVGTVVLANWLTTRFDLVPVGFAVLVFAVPCGTYAAGLALGLRDVLQDRAGIRWVLVAIAAGTVLSFLVADPSIAAASGIAFLAAELIDLAVYTPLRRNGWRRALIVSNVAGSVVDTLLFLWVAGFGLTATAVSGQLLAKAVFCTGAVLAVREVARRCAVPRERQLAEGA